MCDDKSCPLFRADFSGVVEAVGTGVVQFLAGDPVFGTNDMLCGAFAEYVGTAATNLVQKPAGVSWGDAAALPTAGMTALQALRTNSPVNYSSSSVASHCSMARNVLAATLQS